MSREDKPFKIIERIGDNAYKIQLLGDLVVSATFNICNPSSYMEDCFEHPLDLRANPLKE